ncbi:hypothetical protein B0H10DRAFT_2028587 [Mycena sp. CBHHK59/15]|nr:hypothetical protein B0H10DRAFT_2028587 [Mycena sp. CBHHK59/15]
MGLRNAGSLRLLTVLLKELWKIKDKYQRLKVKKGELAHAYSDLETRAAELTSKNESLLADLNSIHTDENFLTAKILKAHILYKEFMSAYPLFLYVPCFEI